MIDDSDIDIDDIDDIDGSDKISISFYHSMLPKMEFFPRKTIHETIGFFPQGIP